MNFRKNSEGGEGGRLEVISTREVAAEGHRFPCATNKPTYIWRTQLNVSISTNHPKSMILWIPESAEDFEILKITHFFRNCFEAEKQNPQTFDCTISTCMDTRPNSTHRRFLSKTNGSALTIQMMKKIKIHEEFVERDLIFYIAIAYLVWTSF